MKPALVLLGVVLAFAAFYYHPGEALMSAIVLVATAFIGSRM